MNTKQKKDLTTQRKKQNTNNIYVSNAYNTIVDKHARKSIMDCDNINCLVIWYNNLVDKEYQTLGPTVRSRDRLWTYC